MTAFSNKSFTVACDSGALTDDEMRERWEAVFGKRPERICEVNASTQTMHFLPCSCDECRTLCRVCGARTHEIRAGRIVVVTDGRCELCKPGGNER